MAHDVMTVICHFTCKSFKLSNGGIACAAVSHTQLHSETKGPVVAIMLAVITPWAGQRCI
jgi:hypothetical protein